MVTSLMEQEKQFIAGRLQGASASKQQPQTQQLPAAAAAAPPEGGAPTALPEGAAGAPIVDGQPEGDGSGPVERPEVGAVLMEVETQPGPSDGPVQTKTEGLEMATPSTGPHESTHAVGLPARTTTVTVTAAAAPPSSSHSALDILLSPQLKAELQASGGDAWRLFNEPGVSEPGGPDETDLEDY